MAYAVHQAVRYLRDLSLSMGIKRKIGSEMVANDSTNVAERWDDLWVEYGQETRFLNVDRRAVSSENDPLLWAAYIHFGL